MSQRQNRPSRRGPFSGKVLVVVLLISGLSVLVIARIVDFRTVSSLTATTATVSNVVYMLRLRRGRKEAVTGSERRRRKDAAALRRAARLLPAGVREEYLEEWRAWMADLRKAGAPWYRRLTEWTSIVLIAAPRLAVTLRLDSQRVVD